MSTDTQALADPQVVQAIAAYFATINSRDREAWMELFAPDASVHDPVGAPAVEGEQGLHDLWSGMTGPFSHLSIEPEEIFYAGMGAAVRWTGKARGINGGQVDFAGISVFEISTEARIQALMAYWDPADTMLRLAEAG